MVRQRGLWVDSGRVLEPVWVPFDRRSMLTWESTLSAEGYRAATMCVISLFCRGRCPAGTGRLEYYCGPATGGMRGPVAEVDRLLAFDDRLNRYLEWVEDRRAVYMDSARANSERRNGGIERKARSDGQERPSEEEINEAALSYEQIQEATAEWMQRQKKGAGPILEGGGGEGLKTTGGGTAGATGDPPAARRRETVEEAPAAGRPSPPLEVSAPGSAGPLEAGSEGRGGDAPPSPASPDIDLAEEKLPAVCLSCGTVMQLRGPRTPDLRAECTECAGWRPMKWLDPPSPDPALADRKEILNVQESRGKDGVHLSGLPRPRGAGAADLAREDAEMLAVRPAHGAVVNPRAKRQKTTRQDARGGVAAKRVRPQHGQNRRAKAPPTKKAARKRGRGGK